jgi:hypothetical protein
LPIDCAILVIVEVSDIIIRKIILISVEFKTKIRRHAECAGIIAVIPQLK